MHQLNFLIPKDIISQTALFIQIFDIWNEYYKTIECHRISRWQGRINSRPRPKTMRLYGGNFDKKPFQFKWGDPNQEVDFQHCFMIARGHVTKNMKQRYEKHITERNSELDDDGESLKQLLIHNTNYALINENNFLSILMQKKVNFNFLFAFYSCKKLEKHFFYGKIESGFCN